MTPALERRLRLVPFRSILFGEKWSLHRVCDGRTEATGFDTEDEARAWATEQGWQVIA